MSQVPALHGDDLLEEVVDAYSNFYDEIETGEHSEPDLIPRLVREVFTGALGWENSDYEQETDWNDVRFYDENRRAVMLVEAKARDVDVDEGIDQAFRYGSDCPYVQYLVATNFDTMKIFEVVSEDDADEYRHGIGGKEIAEIPFEGIINTVSGKGIREDLDPDQLQELRHINKLWKSEIVNAERYDDFQISDRHDVSDETGFQNLLDTLNTCLDDYLLPYTLDAFDEYFEYYEEYESKYEDIKSQIEELEGNGDQDSEVAKLKTERANLEDEYEPYRRLNNDFQAWVSLTNRQDKDRSENKRIFCRETVYVQLNKILLIRIAEDKGLTNRMISYSDGETGVEGYITFWDEFTQFTDKNYTDLFEVASDELSEIYTKLYARQIFDWPLDTESSEFDRYIQKTFWHLNRYNFASVRRDILGNLYEKHLSPEERKELGEFYTPTAVVDLILDRAGYTSDNSLEDDDNKLLDPACGSGTFLVRAAERLIERLDDLNLPPKRKIKTLQEQLWGFDLDPFATHIAQMNLLFQTIDIYKEAKSEDPDYQLGGFNIFQTDALREHTQTYGNIWQDDALAREYVQERRDAESAKSNSDYGFVVGNPPYVSIQNLPSGPAKDEYQEYDVTYDNWDLYVVFFEAASEWLQEGGTLAYITSNKFITNEYGRDVKRLIPQRFQVRELINIGDADVFEDATTYPLITIGTRNAEQRHRSPEDFVIPEYTFSYVEVGDSFSQWLNSTDVSGWRTDLDEQYRGEEENYRATDLLRLPLPDTPGGEASDLVSRAEEQGIEVPDSIDFQKNPPLHSYPVISDSIGDENWRFVPPAELPVLVEMEDQWDTLSTFCRDGDVERGLRTGKNPVFNVDQETIDDYDIEDRFVEPLVGGKDVKRWEDLWEDKYVLYTPNGTDVEDTNLLEYYEENREEAEDRYCVREGQNLWWELDKPKSPDDFEQPKIIVPDIAYYNNFWVDESEFYCLDTTYYIIPDSIDIWYLAGILQSDAFQFYFRRNTARYRGNYLRYKSKFLEKAPIPDPDSVDDETFDTIRSTSIELQDEIESYRKQESLVENPQTILEGLETDILGLATYVERMPDADPDEEASVSPRVDEEVIHLNMTDTVEFTDNDAAEHFARFIQIMDFDGVSDLVDTPVPKTLDDLLEAIDTYGAAEGIVESAGEDLRDLEDELHDAVYEAYDLSEENTETIRSRVETPENPLLSKVR